MDLKKEWKGVPREQVPWYPTIDMDTCTGCRTFFEAISFPPLQVLAGIGK